MNFVKKLVALSVITALSIGVATTSMAAELTVKSKHFVTGVVSVDLPDFTGGAGSSVIDAAVTVIAAKNVANSLESVIPNGKVYNTEEFVSLVKDEKNPVVASQDFIKGLVQATDAALAKAAQTVGKNARVDKYYVDCRYDVYTATPKLLSFRQLTMSNTGGAHANLNVATNTVNMKSGKYLSLSELFIANSDYKERLEWIIDKQQKSVNRMCADLGRPTVDYKKVKITGKELFCYDTKNLANWSLIIYYNPGEIAPISAGLVQYRIPMELILDIVDDANLK